MTFQYKKIFDIDKERTESSELSTDRLTRDASAYRMSEDLELAVNVALATGRLLLICGDPGSGKSTAAAYVAYRNGWRYYQHVVTSRSEARDLQYRFDNLRRLQDAQAGELKEKSHYVSPGELWWALAAAEDRVKFGESGSADPNLFPESVDAAAVLLIDEIDKADPDYPNNLLVPLGAYRFTIPEQNDRDVKLPENQELLVVITTNGERELPPAFLRRCVIHRVSSPKTVDELKEIAEAHVESKNLLPNAKNLFEELAGKLLEARTAAKSESARAPSIAEYLDLVKSCQELGIKPGDDSWETVERLVVRKWDSQRQV